MAKMLIAGDEALSLRSQATDYETLCEAFQASVAARGDARALVDSESGAQWSWAEAGRDVHRIAAGLAGLGVSKGDTVAMALRNRPEFNLVDAAAFHLGAIPWSVYLTSAPEQIHSLLAQAHSKVVIAEADLLPRLREAAAGTDVEHIIDVEQLDTLPNPPGGFDFDTRWRDVEPDTPLTIIWTSGTTGRPKPVELTHRSMLHLLDAISHVTGVQPGGRLLSYLPSAHVGDRWSAHGWWMTLGAEMTCVRDIANLMATTAHVHPTIWGSVPRVWEKLRAALEAQGIAEPARLPDEARHAVRTKLGLDQVEILIVGAAPLAPETLQYFEDLGLPICEIWGLSETSGILTANAPGARRIGTVGLPLPGVELRLAEDGEVFARGPMLMSGYRDQPGLTGEAIIDGWLRTGDVGVIGDDGYVSIIDRKKELIINSGGKNMSPLAIEAVLKTAGPLIGQACAIGDRRPYNVALLVLDADAVGVWAVEHGKAELDYASLSRDPEVLDAVDNEVKAGNARLSRIEQIKAWQVMGADWLPDSDELTPTMKLKRRPIAEKYADLIDSLYARASAAHALS
jgi:long-subunit acyl-CoA synthetase (AMP-forming)